MEEILFLYIKGHFIETINVLSSYLVTMVDLFDYKEMYIVYILIVILSCLFCFILYFIVDCFRFNKGRIYEEYDTKNEPLINHRTLRYNPSSFLGEDT